MPERNLSSDCNKDIQMSKQQSVQKDLIQILLSV